jgi:hypothetical protein
VSRYYSLESSLEKTLLEKTLLESLGQREEEKAII